MPLELTDGWTANMDFQLKADGTPVDISTISSITLILIGSDGTTISTAGKVLVTDAVNGKVRYSPAAGDLVYTKTPYTAHFKVTDGAGRISFFPSGAADPWAVFKA